MKEGKGTGRPLGVFGQGGRQREVRKMGEWAGTMMSWGKELPAAG